MEHQKVLGLSLNTRMVGLAVIGGTLLIDYQISLRKGAWSLNKRNKVLTSLQSWCTSYTIINIALATPHENQSNEQINELLESIKAHCKSNKIKICSYPPQAVYRFCEENQPRTKKEVMKKMCELYPELLTCFNKEKRNKNKYYVKLFDAVALATIHSRKLKGKR